MADADPIRVIVVDDSDDVRFIVAVILGDHDDITLVAQASNAREALAQVDDAAPDVAIVDVRMPIVDGFECSRQLLERRPGLPIALLTSLVDETVQAQATSAGVRAVADKADFDALPELVRRLAASASR